MGCCAMECWDIMNAWLTSMNLASRPDGPPSQQVWSGHVDDSCATDYTSCWSMVKPLAKRQASA